MSTRPILFLLAGLLVLAPLGPFAGAQSDGATRETRDVTFYGHIFGNTLDGPMPANTEAPIGESNYGLGSFDWCTPAGNAQGLPPLPSETTGCDADRNNKVALFSTAGFVDVKDRTEFLQNGGYAQLHNERGQTKDVQLDTTKSVTASIFLSVDFHSWAVSNQYGTNCLAPHPPDVPCLYPYWGWDPGFQPAFVVKATLYKANLGAHGANASDAPPVRQAIESGSAVVIAEGQWGPGDVTTGLPGHPNALEFPIDLGPPQVPVIEKSNDFFLVYSFYSESGGNKVGIHSWRIWSGEFFPPTFTLPVKNAFDVERVIPNFAHGKLAILGVMNTPWGSYDIDPNSVEMTIEGPNGLVEPQFLTQFGDFSVAHGGHYLPINITWIWDYQKERLSAGTYTISLTASNFQHSAQATCEATFVLKSGTGGTLRPGEVVEGVCGDQSASDDFLEEITEGASQTGGS